MNPLESELQSALLLAAPRALPTLRLFRRNVGAATYGAHTVTFGIRGQCDIYALARGGLHVELELKAAGGRLSKDQARWGAFCRTWEIPYALLHTDHGETIGETIVRWIAEINSMLKA
jgi:hypothetical protein